MLAYIAPIGVFGLVIFVHELGHFIAAKLTGVYAPRFSIGFGPALFRMRRGETEYVLALLPLGGYVRMASRHDAETAFIEGGNEETGALKPGEKGYDPEAMIPFGPKPVPEERWFESKSLAARLFIMIAGVTMNVLLAFTVLTTLRLWYGEVVIATKVVGAVHAPANPPAVLTSRGATMAKPIDAGQGRRTHPRIIRTLAEDSAAPHAQRADEKQKAGAHRRASSADG